MPPWPCTIGFGRPGRAGGVEDPERGVEGQPHVVRLGRLRGQLVPGRPAVERGRPRRGRAPAPSAFSVGSSFCERLQPFEGRVLLAVVDVAVHPEQDRRLDLPEPVEHPARPRSPASRTTTPPRSTRRPGTRSRACSAFGSTADDPVALLDPEPPQPGGGAGDEVDELGVLDPHLPPVLAERRAARGCAGSQARASAFSA